MPTIAETLAQLTEALRAVSPIADALEAQEGALRADEADALTRLLAGIHPIMRSVDTLIHAAADRPGGQHTHWTYTEMPEHGIVLAGQIEKDVNEDENRGDYVGADLVLTRAGNLIYRTFAGNWSRWQGAAESWTTDAMTITPADALAYFDLEAIINGMVAAIKRAIANSEAKQRTLAIRLARLAAVKAALSQ